MTIGIDARTIEEKRKAGINTYTFEIINNLSADCRLYMKSSAGKGVYDGKEHINTYKLAFPFYRYKMEEIWETTALPWMVNKHKPELFWGPRFYVPPRLKCPSVCSIHDIAFKFVPGVVNAKQFRYFERLIGYARRHADHFIAVSKTTKMDFCEHYQVSPERVSVVYNGYNRFFRQKADPEFIRQLRTRLNIPKDFIFFLGTLEPRKNIRRLVDAYLSSEACLRGIPLVLGGKAGWMDKSWLYSLQPYVDQGLIIQTGYLSQQSVRALFQSCLFFAFPSLYEGFGVPVLEAMASGAPVLTSNNSALKELFEGSALLIDPLSEDSIVAGMNQMLDSETRKYYSSCGERLTEGFSWRASSNGHLQVFKKLAGSMDQALHS
jgi:glycosyltransferase involved in cell wall biosynthesis